MMTLNNSIERIYRLRTTVVYIKTDKTGMALTNITLEKQKYIIMLRNSTERIYRLYEPRCPTLRQTRLRNGPEHYNVKEIEIYDDAEELLCTYFDSTNFGTEHQDRQHYDMASQHRDMAYPLSRQRIDSEQRLRRIKCVEGPRTTAISKTTKR